MSIERLRPLIEIGMRIGRTSLERDKTVHTFFVLHFPDGHTEEFHVPPDAGRVMNSFVIKEALFGLVRAMVEDKGADATIMVSEMWAAQITVAAKGLPEAQIKHLFSERDYQTGVELGLIERHEVIGVLAQDAEEIMQVSQRFRRENGCIVYYGEQEELTVPQGQFSGSTKMFGERHRMRPAAIEALREAMEFVRAHATPE